jgi:hypothetical protein
VAYDPERWHDAYVMLGSAAAALTGLVFVALSIHLRAIGADRFQRARGHYLTFGLIYLTVVSAFVLAPGQGHNALGVELLFGGVAAIAVTAIPIVRMRSQLPTTLAFHTRVVALTVSIALNFAAGVSLIVRRGGGLYLLLAALVIAMVTNVSGAWSLLMGLTADD